MSGGAGVVMIVLDFWTRKHAGNDVGCQLAPWEVFSFINHIQRSFHVFDARLNIFGFFLNGDLVWEKTVIILKKKKQYEGLQHGIYHAQNVSKIQLCMFQFV